MQAEVIRFIESIMKKILASKEACIHKAFIYFIDRLKYYPHFNIKLLRRSQSYNKILAALQRGNQVKLLYVYRYCRKIIQQGQLMELFPQFNCQLPKNPIKIPELNYFQNIHKFEQQICREFFIRNIQIPLTKENNPILVTCFQKFTTEAKPSISQMVCSLANYGGGKILISKNNHKNTIYQGFPHISQKNFSIVRAGIQNAIKSIGKNLITFQTRKRSLKYQLMTQNKFRIQQIIQIQIKVQQNKNVFILNSNKIFKLYLNTNQWEVRQIQNQYGQIINLYKLNRNAFLQKISYQRVNEYRHFIYNKVSLQQISELIDDIKKEDILKDFPKISDDQSIILVNFIDIKNYKIVENLYSQKKTLFQQIVPFKNMQNKISQYMNYTKLLVYFIMQKNKQISKQLKKILNKQTIYEITSKNSIVIHQIKENQLFRLMEQIKKLNLNPPSLSKQLYGIYKLNQNSFKVVIKFPDKQTIGIVFTCFLLIYVDLRFQIKTN